MCLLLLLPFRSGVLTLDLLERAVEKHPDVLAMLFHDLLRVSDALLRTHDPKIRAAGARMQSAAFRGFSDQFDRNTVIDQFRTQIADKSDTQAADAALAELYLLAQRDPQAVTSFHAHLSGLQEQLLHFTDEQLRCLMDILAMMQVQTVRHTAEQFRWLRFHACADPLPSLHCCVV